MSVESLNLSARTLNCLKRASIHKVGEILEKSRADLLRIRNFGARSLEELDEKLAEVGIRHPELPGAGDGAQAEDAEPGLSAEAEGEHAEEAAAAPSEPNGEEKGD